MAKASNTNPNADANTGTTGGTTPGTTTGAGAGASAGASAGAAADAGAGGATGATPDIKKDKHATERSYITARESYCTALRTAWTDRESARVTYDRSLVVYDKRKHLLEWTEKNYRMYRNLDLCLDTALTTGNASLTANVTAYNALSGTLYSSLTGITAAAKKLKTLVLALRDRASDLENYKNDQCNAGQWGLLTGENVENCKPVGGGTVPRERPDACKDAVNVYKELISITRKSLVFDVDSVIQSSADVTGIHTFSNIAVLTTLQTQLTTASGNFVTQIKAAVTARSTDLTTVQNNLVTAMQDSVKAGVDNFNKIAVYSGVHHTLEFLCNPSCSCAIPLNVREPERRLHACECRICDIGKSIKVTYPGAPQSTPQPQTGTPGTTTGGASGAAGAAGATGATGTPQ
ncbi:MAG TPA: hypothetical protein VNU70_09935 [Puia sp.]|nr:hypothetical protein [Puia sp.]